MCTTSYSFFLSFFLPCSSCSPYHVCFSFSFRESAVWSWFRARCRWQKTEGQGRGPWNRVRLNKGCAHVLARGRGRRRVSGCDDGACVFFFFLFFFCVVVVVVLVPRRRAAVGRPVKYSVGRGSAWLGPSERGPGLGPGQGRLASRGRRDSPCSLSQPAAKWQEMMGFSHGNGRNETWHVVGIQRRASSSLEIGKRVCSPLFFIFFFFSLLLFRLVKLSEAVISLARRRRRERKRAGAIFRFVRCDTKRPTAAQPPAFSMCIFFSSFLFLFTVSFQWIFLSAKSSRPAADPTRG